MRIIIILVLLNCFTSFSNAQNRNSIWCFGDSAGIDFNIVSNPVPIITGFDTRGSCVSISDTNGQLSFYANTRATFIGNTTRVWSKNDQIMQFGDSIVGRGWYNELAIIPQPLSDSLFYLFGIGVTSIYGFYYSIIDLSMNGGLGSVTQKNIQLQTFPNVDCLNAIKHGNGRDWWVIFRESGGSPGNPNNIFYQYLITPSGISNVSTQSVGSINSTNLGKITFSPLGDKMVFNSYRGMIEMYDYDRCTGSISTPVTIFQETILPPYNHFWGCEFSPNGNLLYVTISDQTSYLFQFDLTAPNIAASIDTLWSTSFPGEAIGALKRGPDGKIYESGPYTNPAFFVYPYPDSVYNMYNMNLGVINSPDSLGAACDFQPYSFYLGGKRTYWGLPNNPDYDMPALAGSSCDSLTAMEEIAQHPISELHVYCNSSWQTAFINAEKLKGKQYTLLVYDLMGKEVFRESGKLVSPYFTKNLNCGGYSPAMYVVSLQTESERLVKRFLIN